MQSIKLHHLEKLFKEFLEPNDIIDKIPQLGVFSATGTSIQSIQSDDIKSRHQRLQIFLKWFETYNPDKGNKYVELIDILRTDENYSWLVPFLNDCQTFDDDFSNFFESVEKVDKIKRILRILFPALKGIHVDDVLHFMHGTLSDDDREHIKKVVDIQSNRYGLYSLMNRLIYKKPIWMESFIRAIEELKYGAPEMFEGSYNTLGEALRDYFGYFDESSDNASWPKRESVGLVEGRDASIGKADSTSDKYFQKTPPTENHPCADRGIKTYLSVNAVRKSEGDATEPGLRNYQKELCKSAVCGENVIICAPTGSGKTIVAAHIIKEHLRHNPSGKVLFFTPTGGLAQQQFGKMKEYLSQDISIEMLRGSLIDDSDKDFQRKIYTAHLIVMTPQILLNCLEHKFVTSVFDFTLMIFDECHHARASHPFSEILKKYHDGKEKSIQIIGLTATLGVGTATNGEEAKDHIFKLLGIMDATGGISTVRKHEDELNDICSSAEEETILIKIGDDDKFFDLMKAAILKVIEVLTKIGTFTKMNVGLPKEVENLTKEFDSWCYKLKHEACRHIDEKDTMGRDSRSGASTMLRLKSAYSLCHNCQPSDALRTLEYFTRDHFAENQEKNTEVEKQLHALLKDTVEDLRKCISESGLYPKILQIMEDKISQKEKDDPDFRCMIMVSKRLYAEYLMQWIKSSESLKRLGAVKYIGVGSKSDGELPGMTHKKQNQAIESFRKGENRIMMCTPDAAGEGIDIANCSLVITVDCVKNEIARVQLAGRARKENSKVLYIYFGQNGERDKLPKHKELLMKRATRTINKIFDLERDEYKKKLERGFKEAMSILNVAQAKRSISPGSLAARTERLLCRYCSDFICTTGELIRINGNQHTVYESSFKNKYRRSGHRMRGRNGWSPAVRHVYRISCRECNCEWGNEVAWKVNDSYHLVPIITIRGFKLVDFRGWVQQPSKWKNAKLIIPEKSAAEVLCEPMYEKLPATDDLKLVNVLSKLKI